MTTTDPQTTAPVRAGARLPLLDVLRGVAIMGTLATNVWLFTAPGSEAGLLFGADSLGTLADVAESPSAASLGEGLFLFLANGKFLALLTLLFGVGLAIQFRSAARRGGRWPGPYMWRALFLFTEGLVHFTLVFAADVLMGYAVTSLVVAWLLTRSQRAQNAVMWTAAAVHAAFIGLLTAALVLDPAPFGGETPPEVVDLYAHGSYADQIAFRLDHALLFRAEPIITFALMVFMFLLGVRLFRAGAFGADDTGRRVRGRLLAWGLGVGVPFNLATSLAGPDLALLDRYVAAPVVALGVIGLVGWVLDRANPGGRAVTAVSSLGRMAMSGYVAQNLACVLVLYGFGLGLAPRLADAGPWWVMGLWATLCALLLAVSTLWLRRFRAGPLEALQKAVLARVPERRR
ncbi:DUF418 domain-containing protein [Nocardiopsis sp. CT-R113]|uniref:DUF418 domain-containing protein n=1 Tax=Nocardiopsis codii TaxID=3065942 RepID=A0ABU7K231_9ACTN|nr:DUF418 domain-containing protein [Nocardiopsis sp. CT-R113]MEE2036305.1 DUF418 domain-containing protein [Nocardiopsis sp. CT-R113]